MKRITNTECPRCGSENPHLTFNEENEEEYLVCFACGYQKMHLLERNIKGDVILPTKHEERVIDNMYGAVLIDYEKPRKSIPPGLVFRYKADYDLFKEHIGSISLESVNIKNLTFGRFDNGELIKDKL